MEVHIITVLIAVQFLDTSLVFYMSFDWLRQNEVATSFWFYSPTPSQQGYLQIFFLRETHLTVLIYRLLEYPLQICHCHKGNVCLLAKLCPTIPQSFLLLSWRMLLYPNLLAGCSPLAQSTKKIKDMSPLRKFRIGT